MSTACASAAASRRPSPVTGGTAAYAVSPHVRATDRASLVRRSTSSANPSSDGSGVGVGVGSGVGAGVGVVSSGSGATTTRLARVTVAGDPGARRTWTRNHREVSGAGADQRSRTTPRRDVRLQRGELHAPAGRVRLCSRTIRTRARPALRTTTRNVSASPAPTVTVPDDHPVTLVRGPAPDVPTSGTVTSAATTRGSTSSRTARRGRRHGADGVGMRALSTRPTPVSDEQRRHEGHGGDARSGRSAPRPAPGVRPRPARAARRRGTPRPPRCGPPPSAGGAAARRSPRRAGPGPAPRPRRARCRSGGCASPCAAAARRPWRRSASPPP